MRLIPGLFRPCFSNPAPRVRVAPLAATLVPRNYLKIPSGESRGADPPAKGLGDVAPVAKDPWGGWV